MAEATMPLTAIRTAPAATHRPPRTPDGAMNTRQLRQAAQDFEAFYLARALEPMFAGLSSEPPFGGGMAEDMWRSLLIDEYGKAIAEAGGIGVADAIVRELIDVQQKASAAHAQKAQAPAAETTPVETKTP